MQEVLYINAHVYISVCQFEAVVEWADSRGFFCCFFLLFFFLFFFFFYDRSLNLARLLVI